MMNREVACDNHHKKEFRLQRRVKHLLTLSENKFCLDCSKPRPRCATVVVIFPPINITYDSVCLLFKGGVCRQSKDMHRNDTLEVNEVT